MAEVEGNSGEYLTFCKGDLNGKALLPEVYILNRTCDSESEVDKNAGQIKVIISDTKTEIYQ